MDTWTKLTEFFACGLLVLPAMLGYGLDSFEVFAVTLGLLQIVMITVTLGAPTLTLPESKRDGHRPPR